MGKVKGSKRSDLSGCSVSMSSPSSLRHHSPVRVADVAAASAAPAALAWLSFVLAWGCCACSGRDDLGLADGSDDSVRVDKGSAGAACGGFAFLGLARSGAAGAVAALGAADAAVTFGAACAGADAAGTSSLAEETDVPDGAVEGSADTVRGGFALFGLARCGAVAAVRTECHSRGPYRGGRVIQLHSIFLYFSVDFFIQN